MKLYYKPGACSLSPHIVLREAGLPFELDRVDTKSGKTQSGGDFASINPKGYVPSLQLDDGQVLTEGAVIVQYLADRKPEMKLAPASGTMERYRLQEWLNFIATEIHKSFSPLFNRKAPDEVRQAQLDRLGARLDYLAKQLEKRPFLMGNTFSVADAYLFTILKWAKVVNLDLARWPSLTAFQDRVGSRPAVRAAMEAEGLLS
ncbi:MAG TPA: glutathione transferase GstA [Myxococcaceae bacterium]|nr:glutathione transferase GstA [Myxococcaceae bacterium]